MIKVLNIVCIGMYFKLIVIVDEKGLSEKKKIKVDDINWWLYKRKVCLYIKSIEIIFMRYKKNIIIFCI